MFNILHISLHDRTWGIGREARLLHESLPTFGIESNLWASEIKNVGINIFPFQANKTSSQQSPLTNADLLQIFSKYDLTKVDVIHIHLTETYYSPLLLPFFQLKPVVLSIYDASLYTAGCKHSAHCDYWQEKSCEACPLYAADKAQQLKQQQIFALKDSLYKTQKLHIVYHNAWQGKQLKESMLKNQPLVKLPLLCDTQIFYAGDKQLSRVCLGLAQDNFEIILYGGETVEFSKRFCSFVRPQIENIRQQGDKVTLVYIGHEELPPEAADVVRNLPYDCNGALLAEYYRSADVLLYFNGLDQSYAIADEAVATALPIVVFDIGAARDCINEKTGFVIDSFDAKGLKNCLQTLLRDADKMKVNLKELSQVSMRERMNEYIRFYETIAGKKAGWQLPVANNTANDTILPHYLLGEGWEKVAAYVNEKVTALGETKDKNIFVDKFFLAVFEANDIKADKYEIWNAIKLWMSFRKFTGQLVFSSLEERKAHLDASAYLRGKLTQYFSMVTLEEFKKVDEKHSHTIIQLWRAVFLNVTSVLHADTKEFSCDETLLKEERQTGYPFFFIKTMYYPYAEKAYEIDINATIHAGLPLSQKIVIMLWLTTAPLYSGTEFHRQHVLKYVKFISKYMAADLKILSPDLCIMFIEHFVQGLWRVSYLGGNNIEALRQYGKFIRENVKYRYPELCKPIKPRKRRKGEKLRVGYISMNFRNQAVSQYMANRFIYHDKNKFFVKTFILKRHVDEVTERIKGHSDEWVEFDDLLNFKHIAETVKKSKLDILVFADIGMEVLTYTLGAMNLAPKQVVLVGHGTTTGLPTLDYYISGDHEAEEADAHYTEGLIRLPNAGVAQLPPSQNESKMTRKEIGVPEDAVMFISCANGIKHYYTRDDLLIEILQKAPKAYIVLKPFQSTGTVDYKFMDRIKAKAKAAGVEARLIQLPPLPNPGDLMGLITLADVQLDTYPYGGWTTNLEALYYHLPIVTQYAEMARTRWGKRLLEVLDIQEGIAKDEREYVEWAVKFATDDEMRNRVTMQIKDKAAAVLFNGEKAQPAYEDALIKMIEAKKRGKA